MQLDLDALETSFDLIAPHGDELMDIFYARLFAAAPAVKPLFAGTDFRRQKALLPPRTGSRHEGAWIRHGRSDRRGRPAGRAGIGRHRLAGVHLGGRAWLPNACPLT